MKYILATNKDYNRKEPNTLIKDIFYGKAVLETMDNQKDITKFKNKYNFVYELSEAQVEEIFTNADGIEVTLSIPFAYDLGQEGPITGKMMLTERDVVKEVREEINSGNLNYPFSYEIKIK